MVRAINEQLPEVVSIMQNVQNKKTSLVMVMIPFTYGAKKALKNTLTTLSLIYRREHFSN